MKLTVIITVAYCSLLLFMDVVTSEEITNAANETFHTRQKRQESEPYFPDYYNAAADYSDYPDQSSNFLVPAGIVGGTGLALKAAKAKAKLKGLLAIPAGIALLGGIAALASGIIPPAVIGGINLPFQGKRRKRSINENLNLKFPTLYEKQFLRKSIERHL